ncbi:hypothetical protein KX928_14010 [Roseobacter sp. YSTF-M11]|uniref:Uncharacterized protein n=1 Tax=Roseobacter insulae TaxID=2859783 RepID=A0A9X1JZ60_9RHOB|nr:hypothetical protein [Roseobacter insulae]MBW4708900.1 hypothetical protein [Roseobacter insulae]
MFDRIFIFSAALIGSAYAACADIQPQSGIWAGQVIYDGQTGCPPQVADQMKQARPGYADQKIDFPEPFDPVALRGNDPNFAWSKISTNIWEGIYKDIQQTGVGTLTVVSKSIIIVLAPDEINQIADLTVDLPQNIAQTMGMATTTCVVRSNVYHKRTGP